jgi:Uma2 family endonuclease
MSTKTLLTGEDLWKIVADGSRYELSRGELIPMTPVGLQHSWIVARLGMFLTRFVAEHGLGIVGMEGGFKLQGDPDTLRAPDIHFVPQARIDKEGITEKFADYAPELAVEVLSPDDKASDIQKKIAEYLAGGVKLIWVVEPTTRTVTVYRSHQDIEVVSADQELTGGDLLPGFHVKVADIFAVPSHPEHGR